MTKPIKVISIFAISKDGKIRMMSVWDDELACWTYRLEYLSKIQWPFSWLSRETHIWRTHTDCGLPDTDWRDDMVGHYKLEEVAT